MKINQYKIVIVNLDPTIGSEIRKTRPCVVISPNEMNHFLRTIVIAPLTTTLKKYPSRIKIEFKDIKGMVAIDQIRTIDKQRIVKVVGDLNYDEVKEIKRIIEETPWNSIQLASLPALTIERRKWR